MTKHIFITIFMLLSMLMAQSASAFGLIPSTEVKVDERVSKFEEDIKPPKTEELSSEDMTADEEADKEPEGTPVQRFKITGNNRLSDHELYYVLKNYEGQILKEQDLQNIRVKFERLFKENDCNVNVEFVTDKNPKSEVGIIFKTECDS